MSSKFDSQNMQVFIQDYKSEMPIPKLCEKYKISKQTVYNILKNEGVNLNRQRIHDNCGCPLFKKALYSSIYCEDCGEWEFLTLSFANKEEMRAYFKNFCKCDYENCKVYKVMMGEFL